MMEFPAYEGAKRRLTDRKDIAIAVTFLLQRGWPAEEIAVQLARIYYVDVDLLNEVLADSGRTSQEDGLRNVA
jgi:hypothetical protein